MGDSVKAIAGLALAYFAPVLAGMTTSIWAYGAVLVGATLVGASVVGSAMMPDFDDIGGVESYSGMKLQTQKSNTNAVPQVYGKHRLAGNIIYQTTNTAITNNNADHGYNRDYWSIVSLAGHAINNITNIYANEDTMDYIGTQRYKKTYTHVHWYSASLTATNIQSIEFVTDTSGSESTGATLGLDSVSIPADVSYLAIHEVFDGQQSKNTQLTNITVEIEGKKIRDIVSSTNITSGVSYSNNPALIVFDILTTGLNIADADIDIATFYQAKQDCVSNGWTCNIALVQQANIQSIIQDILATCRGQIVHSDSKWKLKIDTKSQTSVATLTDDDFINDSLTISMKGNREIANKIIVKYINPTDNWLSAQAVKEDTDLQSLDGQTIEKVLDIKGITNQTQAEEMAEITLNTMRYSEDASGNRVKQTPLALSFSTTVKNADLEVGDIISITHNVLDRTRKFMILSLETDQSGIIQVVTREYAETHYKNSSGTYLI